LILLDEILIGQDQQNACFLLDMLAEHVRRNATVVLVNHNPAVTAAYAQRVLFFQGGSLVVDEPVREAFRQLELLGFSQYCGFPPQLTTDHSEVDR
jgi:energy-coupling factor transporter ATP-binding protein EcfA2